jgi:hypothetical protein
MNVEPGFRISYLRIRFSLIAVGVGLLIFSIGAKPNWFGWNRASVVGSVQIVVLLLGLGLICIGGYVGLTALWGRQQRSILADIGSRLLGTGYVITVFSGMADVFGMGAQTLPDNPYFGPLQASGVLTGQFVIALGLLLLIPYHLHAKKTTE